MAMSLKDFRQLEKMMLQTTSDNDAEALTSLRMANRLLAKYGYTWADAFARLVKVDSGVPDVEDGADTIPADHQAVRQVDEDHQRINAAFNDLRGRQLSRNTEQFIRSLEEQWTERGFLTDKQKASLFRNADEYA